MSRPPWVRVAGLREDGVPCAGCSREVADGQEIVTCDDCGSVHHRNCWEAVDGCRSFDCSEAVAAAPMSGEQPIRITAADIDNANPLPPSSAYAADRVIEVPDGPDPEASRWNQLAIISFVIALIGVPLYGIVTGLVAIAVGAVSLTGRNSFRRRGVGLAATGIVLGILEFAGWAVYLAGTGDNVPHVIALEQFEPDPAALEGLPPPLNRAMKANVLIQTGDLFRQAMGSGVILRIENGEGLIVTNRHVIDPDFADGGGSTLDEIGEVTVKGIGQPATIGSTIWLAPEGIDLALLTIPVSSSELLAAAWDASPNIQVGDSVFAIGNPHGLGWTHTSGDVSQIRRQTLQTTEYGVIQTSAAINSGNSGGGLYDEQGHLVGINTWIQDKQVAEGLGFAIVFQTLYELLNGELDLPQRHLPVESE